MQLIWRSGAALASCVARVVFANVIEPQRVLAPRGTTRSARKVVKDWTTKFFYQRLHSICAPATVKSMKTDIIKSDFEVLLSSTATHPSAKYIATVAETTSWCRLRDLALDCGVQGTSSGFIKHSARTLVFSSDSSIWHCCTMPTLYTSTIAREVKMRLLMKSSVLASSLARKVSLQIKMQVAAEGYCSPSLTTLLEWWFGKWRILHPISHWKRSILMVVAFRSQVSQLYRRMGTIHVSKMLQLERGLRLPWKAPVLPKVVKGFLALLIFS